MQASYQVLKFWPHLVLSGHIGPPIVQRGGVQPQVSNKSWRRERVIIQKRYKLVKLTITSLETGMLGDLGSKLAFLL